MMMSLRSPFNGRFGHFPSKSAFLSKTVYDKVSLSENRQRQSWPIYPCKIVYGRRPILREKLAGAQKRSYHFSSKIWTI